MSEKVQFINFADAGAIINVHEIKAIQYCFDPEKEPWKIRVNLSGNTSIDYTFKSFRDAELMMNEITKASGLNISTVSSAKADCELVQHRYETKEEEDASESEAPEEEKV